MSEKLQRVRTWSSEPQRNNLFKFWIWFFKIFIYVPSHLALDLMHVTAESCTLSSRWATTEKELSCWSWRIWIYKTGHLNFLQKMQNLTFRNIWTWKYWMSPSARPQRRVWLAYQTKKMREHLFHKQTAIFLNLNYLVMVQARYLPLALCEQRIVVHYYIFFYF